MAHNLRPCELDSIGFQEAVETMVSRVSTGSKIRFFKQIDSVEGVLTDTKIVYLYRLIQEGLNNILKHARATVVMLEIRKEAEEVWMQLEDNGVGFDSCSQKPGMGLNGMNERAKIIGGTFQLKTVPGEGTRIRIRIPISSNS